MAYDGWIEFNGVELVNLSRTAQLAAGLGISALWVEAEEVAWIEDALDGVDYEDVTTAPWYDAGYPASGEFAGIVPLSFPGLGDSTRTASVTEYISDGGTTSKPRNATLPIVANVVIVASTDRGAEYGKRWLDRLLAGTGRTITCTGHDLRYFRFVDETPQIAHHRNVRTTRGASITRKSRRDCSSLWMCTFTMTAADPFEYGEIIEAVEGLGATASGDMLVSDGTLGLVETGCPVYIYTPIYDPENPALVAPPTSPDFFPLGWTDMDGEEFTRYWAVLDPMEPSLLRVVPIITLNSTDDARMVRVSIFPATATTDEQCEALWAATITYVPGGIDFIIDGEQQASYVFNGSDISVRRTDSLVFSPDARPIDWASFTTESGGLLVALDIFDDSDTQAAVALMSKSE